MKIKFLAVFAFVSVLFSCSSDETNSDDDNSGTVTYISLESDNYWNYKVFTDESEAGTDHLYVGEDVILDTKTYKKMKTTNPPIGFFSNSLNNNHLRKDGASLKLTGTLGVNLGEESPIDITVPITDFVIFKENAANDQELSTTEGVIEQTVGTFPLKIKYILTSKALETLANFTTPAPDAKEYTDVKKVKVVMNMTVTTRQELSPGIFIDVPVMNTQDVVVSIQYYSKNIGMVYANTVISYNLALEIPDTPLEGTQTQEEFLTTYDVD